MGEIDVKLATARAILNDTTTYSPLSAAPWRNLPCRERNLLIFLTLPGIS